MEQGSNSEVGYRRPPAEHRFKPGESGNPNGRPVGTVSLRLILRAKLAETPAGKERRTYGEVLVDETFRLAAHGNAAALRLIWEYTEGKSPQPILLEEDKPKRRDEFADAALFDPVARKLASDLLGRVCSEESQALVQDGLAEAARSGRLPRPQEDY